MVEIESSGKRITHYSPPPPSEFPWLVFTHGKENKAQTFCSVPENRSCFRSVRELHNKEIHNSCYGWLILSSTKDNQFSLWNPVTFDSIHLPPLELGPTSTIEACLLLHPPSHPNSTVFVFDSGISSIWFCCIRDQEWLTHCYEKEIDAITNTCFRDPDLRIFLTSPISCNNEIYALTSTQGTLVWINLIGQPKNHIVLVSLGKLPVPSRQISNIASRDLVESRGDIFLIYSYYKLREDGVEQVIDMELNMLDLGSMEWVRKFCAKNRAFFLGASGRPSCSIVSSEAIGNRIYFLVEGDCCLYVYHIEDWHVSTSLPCPDLLSRWNSPIWVMPDRLITLDGKAAEERGKEVSENKKTVAEECSAKDLTKSEEEAKESNGMTRLFDLLPLIVLQCIRNHLSLIDYMNFRLVSRVCREAAPPLRFESAISRSETQNKPLSSPWLVSLQENGLLCTLAHPRGCDRYKVRLPDYLRDATLWHCKDGWLLVSNNSPDKKSQVLTFINPFTKCVVPCQELHNVRSVGECRIAFSSPPTSPNCVVVVITRKGVNRVKIQICQFSRGAAEGWKEFLHTGSNQDQDFCPTNDNPIFSNGAFYFLGVKENIGVLRLLQGGEEEGFYNWQVIQAPVKLDIPSSESFLAERDGKVFLVLTYKMGRFVRVFMLEEDSSSSCMSTSWNRVEDLGNHTLHVSRSSALFTVAKAAEHENKIYFPRLYGEHLVSYSLCTNSLHSSSGRVSLRSYKCGVEPLFCGWIHPCWS